MNNLTSKQKRFCVEYLADCNATQAAIRAGYSKSTSGAIGFENLKKPEIKNEIKSLVSVMEERRIGAREAIISALFREAFENRESTTGAARVSALDKLAKIFNLYEADIVQQTSLEVTLMQIAQENAANRKSLLPKDNIDFEGGDK